MNLEKERDQQIEHAIEKENVDLVKKLIEEGIDLNTWSENHQTPLFSAVAKANCELVNLFLEEGAEVNLPNRHNLGTPLHCASDKGRVDLVILLLKHGADVNISTVYKSNHLQTSKNTALFVASGKGHCDIVRVLIANKAEVNLPNDKNEIPLDIACQSGHLEVVNVLLNNGANVNWSGRWEGTPLIYASHGDYYDIVKLLLDRGADVSPIGQSRPLRTPLFHAVLHGYTDVVRLLLQREADINCPIGNGDTPLHGICFKGHDALAELFLDLGTEVNRPSIDGKSPLYIACASGHSEIADMLLNRGAEIDIDIDSAWDQSWYSPLYMELREGHRKMISSLLNTNSDMSYLYDKSHPMGKTLSEMKTMFFHSKIMDIEYRPLNSIGKFYSNCIIKEHMTKLKAAGLTDASFSDDRDLGRCIAEVKQINSFKIFKNVTLGVVFQRAKNPLYQRNQELLKKIEDYLCSPLLQKEFPIYAQILRNTLEKSKRRLSLLTTASKVLESMECQPKLPLHILENILNNLDESDLKTISSFK